MALVDDYDVVLIGLAHMFDRYGDRIVVAEIDANRTVMDDVDIVLYDSFAQPEADHDEIKVLIENPHARRVVVYTWNFHPELIDSAIAKGASGYLSKTLPARELVAALEAIHAGEQVVSAPPDEARTAPGLDWPGRIGGPHRTRVRDPRADHPGQEQRRGRRDHVPQHELRQVLHPLDVSQDRGDQPHAGRAVGHRARVPTRPSPHRPLARRALTAGCIGDLFTPCSR